MDTRRLILFVVLSLGLMLGWEKYFAPKQLANSQSQASSVTSGSNPVTNLADNGFSLASDKVIQVTTDLMQVQINTLGGDVRGMELLKYMILSKRK